MPETREERRLVTALFADVVGSTAIAEHHDPEEARLIVGEAIARAVRIVEAYGGTVKDLAGDGMLALFGAPVAHEDDPERALQAGLEIAAAVADYAEEVKRGWGVEGFGVRLGAETGEVVVGDMGAGRRVEYGATGDAVNVAARLQAHAAPGTILAGEVAHRLAAGSFNWGEPASLALKGRSSPVTAVRVVSVREGGQFAAGVPDLAGREAEMAAIDEALAALESRRGGIVFVSGEPGIGKSRLTFEARRHAEARGLQWLEGRAVSYGSSLAWWPLRDLLRGWIGVGTQEPELRARLALRRKLDDLFGERSQENMPYLAAVLGLARDPQSSTALEQLSPEALQFQTCSVLEEVLAALAARRPLILAVDDLHWADATTLGVLDRVLTLAETAPVLFFFNHRPETGHASWTLRERATRDFRHLTTVLDLGPLPEAAERRLLSSLSEGAMPAEWADRVIARSAGNPLYLEELARMAGEDVAVPPTLEGVILARMDRLEPEWRELVTAASACGRSFSAGLLTAVAGAREADVKARLHHLLRLDLIREERRWPEPSYRFKHALIQDTAYGTLVARRRRELHARAARWLEERYQDSPQRSYGLLAYHWVQADDTDQAAKYLRLAGMQALEEWALDEAIGQLRDLVAVLRRAGREAEAAQPLYQLAFALHLAMRFAEADAAWREAASVAPPPAAPSSEPAADLVIGVIQLAWDVDPYHAEGSFSANFQVALQLNDVLFTLRPGPCIEPLLADRLEVDASGMRYLIHLKPGLTFNSGRPLDAPAVVESFRRQLRGSGDAHLMWAIENFERLSKLSQERELENDAGQELGVRALDELTVELRLTHPVPHFPVMLTIPWIGGVLPGEASGPYRVTELTPSRVALEADPAYPRARPGNVATVEWRPVTGTDVADRLRSGEIDVAHHMRSAPFDIEGMTNLLGVPSLLIGLWATATSPLVDGHLRRALALGLDRDRLEPHVAPNEVTARGGVVPPALPGHTPAIAPAFDPDEARASLARSAHRGPLLAAYFTPQAYPAVLAAFECWRDVLGLDVEAIPISIKEAPATAPGVHVSQLNWIAHAPDPSYFLDELLHSRSPSNWARVSDPEIDALLARGRELRDGSGRLALYHEVDHMAVAQRHLLIPLLYRRPHTIVQPWVEGWWDWANPNQRLSEVRIKAGSPRLSRPEARPPA